MSGYLENMKGSNSKDGALSPEHDIIINLTSPTENKFLPYSFKLPGASIKQYPRKNRFRFQYKMKKFCIVGTTNTDNSLHSSNSSSDDSYDIYKSDSRSAKIMRALSSNSSREDLGIRKLLNFDSTPSPKNSSYENSVSPINADTSPSTLNSSLTDSIDSNVPTAESIDENQNQTPQHNRKHIKTSSKRTDVKENTLSRSSQLMRLLPKDGKERTDKDANHRISLHPFCSLNSGLNRPSRVITASTPRNLSQEFNQEVLDRPHTPENIINIIPESISAIKKSHKKEKLYCPEEQSSTQQKDVPVKNDDLHSRTTESSGIDVNAETNATSESESQKKNRNPKRTLIYNFDDERLDIGSDFDCSMQEATGTDSLESGLDQIQSDETQDIDFNDCVSHEENMQVSIHLTDDDEEKKDRSKENVCNEKASPLSLQEESSGICNVNATSENRMASPESNPIISQDASKVVTPENHVNVLKHVLTESIKKSHKKLKHGNRRTLFKTKDQEMELPKSEMSLEDACNDDQDKSQTANAICVSSPQNFEFDRPNTPENVNSSRLLLLGFNSVKKSHKKDKRSKRTYSFAECHHEYRKRSNDSLQSSRDEEENIDGISRRNESLGVEESPSMSPEKKKKPRSMSLLSSTPKMPSAFVSLGCKSIDDEVQIYTPIKKPPVLLTVTDYVLVDEMSQKRDESAQATSNEIDCSRCVTPVARFKELRKNEDLASKRDNATEFETDVSVLKTADTVNLKDKNGRSTPINMSTVELLHNIDSIKKSHKKDKHNHSRRPTSKKKRSYIQESRHVSFTDSEKMLEEHTALSLKHHVDSPCAEKEICSIMYEKEGEKACKETDYDDPQPSTSRGADDVQSVKNTTVSKFLNTTPPNSSNAIKFIKLQHRTSIKRSHKKERDMNAQTKYIFMSQEPESDDGSIFDEEDRLSFMTMNDSNTEITTIQ
ncbi:uncharacterized protein [Temnothorax longispinosus]|uniref:uncharacterized protein n=1 Tax=Temnothorax longispinosus TaxID=300112 RepID=UPI003A9A4608